MHTLTRWMLTMVAAAILAGCGSSMMDDAGAMQDHLATMRAENQAHVDAGRAATTMAAMMAEMDRHAAQMADMMGMMDRDMDGMKSHCHGSGMTSMMGMRDQMMDEMDHHAGTMGGTADLDAAHAEIERHGAAMYAMLDQMHGDVSTMRCGGMH